MFAARKLKWKLKIPARQQENEIKRIAKIDSDRAKLSLKLTKRGSATYSVSMNRVALSVVLGLIRGFGKTESMSITAALTLSSHLLQRSYNNLWNLYQRYARRGTMALLDIAKPLRGFLLKRRLPVLTFKLYGASTRAFVVKQIKGGRAVTIPIMQRYLKDAHGVVAGNSSLRMWMKHDLKLAFGKCKPTTEKWNSRRLKVLQRDFIIEFGAELKRESAVAGVGVRRTVIVYSDESYLHEGHAELMSWYDPLDDFGRRIGAGVAKGARLIVLHAMTKHGLLCDRDATGKPIKSPLHPISASGAGVATTELVYVGADTIDYHATMDSDMYMRWIDKQLIPAFERMFGSDCRCVLVIDNAKYHKAMPPEEKAPTSKPAMIDALRRLGMTGSSMTVNRDGKLLVIKESRWRSPSPNGPSVTELTVLYRAWRDCLPDNRCSLLSQRFDSWTARNGFSEHDGHRVLYTPPYDSDSQPIEHLWGYTKRIVAKGFDPDADIAAVRSRLLEAFAMTTPQLCAKIIGNAQQYVMSLIRKHHTISGALDALVIDTKQIEIENRRFIDRRVLESIPDKDHDVHSVPLPPLDVSGLPHITAPIPRVL